LKVPVKLAVTVPDLPRTVPVNVPDPKNVPVPDERRITVSDPRSVPAKSPAVVIESVWVTMRFPSTVLTPVLVAVVVNGPVTVVGVAALAPDSKRTGMRSDRAIRVIFRLILFLLFVGNFSHCAPPRRSLAEHPRCSRHYVREVEC